MRILTHRSHKQGIIFQNQGTFSILKKGQGRPPPLSPLLVACLIQRGTICNSKRHYVQFFMTLSNASKFPVVQYHRKTPTVESFLVKLSAWASNFSNEGLYHSCFSVNFIKFSWFFWKTILGRMPLKKYALYLRHLVIQHSNLQYNSYYIVVPPCTTGSSTS